MGPDQQNTASFLKLVLQRKPQSRQLFLLGIELRIQHRAKRFRCRPRKLRKLAEHSSKILKRTKRDPLALVAVFLRISDLEVSKGDTPQSARNTIRQSPHGLADSQGGSPRKGAEHSK